MNNELKNAIQKKYDVISFNDKNPLSERDKSRFSKSYFMDENVFNIILNENSQFTCFKSKKSNNQYLGVKGITDNGNYKLLNTYKEFHDVDKQGTGRIQISNLSNELVLDVSVREGDFTINKVENQADPGPGSDETVCQAEGGESVDECYDRETDEFCDGFIACATLATNPQVHLLILGLCSCEK